MAYFLLLEQVIKRASGVGRLYGWCLIVATTRVAGLTFDGRTSHEELTSITEILFCNTFGDWLRAFELGGSIKMTAILARTQVGFALLALALESDIYRRGNNRSAERAAKDFLKTRHLHRPWRFSGL